MSSNHDKEAEVRARQKLLAARLAKKPAAPSSNKDHRPMPKAPSTRGTGTSRDPIVFDEECDAERATHKAKRAKRNDERRLKRPAIRRGGSSSVAEQQGGTSKDAQRRSKLASKPTPSAGSLSSILMSNADTAKYMQADAPKLLKHYDKIEPNDYWKNFRDWDFLSDLSLKMSSSNKNGQTNGKSVGKRKGDDTESGETQLRKPLPNTFQSYREYCALWAPLCLDEARAQLLSDAMTEIPYWRKKPEKNPVRVRLQPLRKDVNGSSEDMGLQVKSVLTTDFADRSFMSNDIVLLVKSESYLWDATKGNHSAGGARKSIVGHIQHSRRSLDGLLIQVTRELWGQFEATEVVIVKLGCNITSLREFTALCRMDTIPLLDYILGPGQEKTTIPVTKGDVTDERAEKKAKKEILTAMGGSSALGRGFADFASKKFNVSQLGAISASSKEYGMGGFTLIKGPPGTGKTTTLCALLNALHIRQMNQYFNEVRKLAESYDAVVGKRAALSLSSATRKRPRILVCAPSNAAVDNIILKIFEDGFVDGNGNRYNPSMIRIGRGQSASVKDVCLEEKVERYLSDAMDIAKLGNSIEGFKAECRRIHSDITKLRQRMNAIKNAAPYQLAKEWEIRVDEEACRVYFVNHKDQSTTYEVPPPPEPGQRHFPAEAMPEYKAFVSRVVKMVERYNKISLKLERFSLCEDVAGATSKGQRAANSARQQIETHVLDSVHIVLTTLGTAGARSLEAASKFEVVVVDEAAQSVEPSTLNCLQLGSKHAILVGDPQQLPATIFNVSGKTTKFDRSLFQRLEEAGHEVHLLDTQYRMHPMISLFPRRIFYDGKLLDGPNVKHPEYGSPLKRTIFRSFGAFQPFTILDLESTEDRAGTSMANTAEAQLALHLFQNLRSATGGQLGSRVAVITPYSQQAALLRRTFSSGLGSEYERSVEISSVDAFQGREAHIVIFSCVRAAGSKGIGFLADVRRMNVALTRAKHFLFVIARCSSIRVNPYWRDLVKHASGQSAVVKVPFSCRSSQCFTFPQLSTLKAEKAPAKPMVPPYAKEKDSEGHNSDGELF